jgi:hypothetical protein
VKRVLVLGFVLALTSPASARHRKLQKRSHRTTVASASHTASPKVEIGGDATDPIGGLGHVPHKRTKKH